MLYIREGCPPEKCLRLLQARSQVIQRLFGVVADADNHRVRKVGLDLYIESVEQFVPQVLDRVADWFDQRGQECEVRVIRFLQGKGREFLPLKEASVKSSLGRGASGDGFTKKCPLPGSCPELKSRIVIHAKAE